MMTSFKSKIEPFISRYGYMVVDGGLATELENMDYDLNHPLWSARILLTNPDAIKQVHLSYLKSGADCIITSSYQASFQGLIEQGYSRGNSKQLIRDTVNLAEQARSEFLELNNKELRPLIAGSIGPYGAYLADGSEYTGNYGISKSQLVDFHKPRWDILMNTGIDLLAVETIPSALEAEVIHNLLSQSPQMEAWICFSCGDSQNICDGTPISEVVKLFNDLSNVTAVGVNCTDPGFVKNLIGIIKKNIKCKRIIVYPNSGERYDSFQHKWLPDKQLPDFPELAKGWYGEGANIIGGCCRTTPEMIRNVKQQLMDEAALDTGI